MRKYSRARKKIKTIINLAIILVPFLFAAWYAMTAFSLYHSLVEFSYENQPDPTTFLSANRTHLQEMAEYYDQRYEEFHIPLNFSTDTIFTDANCTEVLAYAYSDNGAQFTGLSLTGWIFKYLVAKQENNSIMLENTTRVIRKLVTGMSMLLAVPNGGIGSEYSGILARGYAGPNNKDIAQFYFDDLDRHKNGTGIYSDWRWRSYTSNDEYSGFYSGLGLLLKYIDLPDVQNLTKVMIDQLANYMLATNFLGVDYHGGPTGVEQKPRFFIGGTWVCILLKMAAIAYPEKYEHYYQHYAVEQFYAWWSNEGGEQETVANYYAYAFGYHVLFTLIVLEESEALRNLFLQKFKESLWSYTQYHRNAFFNIIFLWLTAQKGEYPIIEGDIEDILARWDVCHFPDRKLGHLNLTDDYMVADNFAKISKFMDQNPFGILFQPIFMELQDTQYLNKPLTPEYRPSNIFIWERNPYQYQEPQISANYEFTGSSFSTPYWMARAFGLLTPP